MQRVRVVGLDRAHVERDDRKRRPEKPKITQKDIPRVYPPGSDIIIQVTKGPIGTKGPRVTCNVLTRQTCALREAHEHGATRWHAALCLPVQQLLHDGLALRSVWPGDHRDTAAPGRYVPDPGRLRPALQRHLFGNGRKNRFLHPVSGDAK